VHQYGAEKGKQVFYASLNKNKEGSATWHKKSGGSYSHDAVAMAKVMKG
jgi:hypothetical protein